jgi:hypothetical protein
MRVARAAVPAAAPAVASSARREIEEGVSGSDAVIHEPI